jgi:hypothetical protein
MKHHIPRTDFATISKAGNYTLSPEAAKARQAFIHATPTQKAWAEEALGEALKKDLADALAVRRKHGRTLEALPPIGKAFGSASANYEAACRVHSHALSVLMSWVNADAPEQWVAWTDFDGAPMASRVRPALEEGHPYLRLPDFGRDYWADRCGI